MRDLHDIRSAAAAHGSWSLINERDEEIYREFSAKAELDEFSYERNWAFLTQETRHLGLKRITQDAMWFAVIRYDESPYVFVFPPVGRGRYRARDVRAIDSELRELAGRRVIFRKVNDQHFAEIMQLQEARSVDASVFTDARDVPEDVKPQVVVGVDASVARAGGHFMQVRNHIRRFTEDQRPKAVRLSKSNPRDVHTLVARWNDEGRAHFRSMEDAGLEEAPANAGAYTIFAERFAERVDDVNYFGRIVYVGDEPAGFVFAGRTSPQSAGLYGSMSLTKFRGASEFLLSCILTDLQAAGVRYLNMGGSETDQLFRFKSKFHVVALRSAFDVTLDPRPGGGAACAADSAQQRGRLELGAQVGD
jgi:hypothetical protein